MKSSDLKSNKTSAWASGCIKSYAISNQKGQSSDAVTAPLGLGEEGFRVCLAGELARLFSRPTAAKAAR